MFVVFKITTVGKFIYSKSLFLYGNFFAKRNRPD